MTVKCMYYPDHSKATLAQIEAQIAVLESWPRDFNDAVQGDPRCGCGAPDAICEWDSVTFLEELLPPVEEKAGLL